MTLEQIAGLLLTLLFMAIGLAGSFIPGLPSTPLVLLGAVLHKLYFGEAGAGLFTLMLLTGFTILSLVVDYLATVYGARRLGATWRGVWGAVIGGLVGMFFNLPGILLGPFVGAALFELSGGREWREACRAGLGALIGLAAGVVGRVGICLLMMMIFLVNVVIRSLQQGS